MGNKYNKIVLSIPHSSRVVPEIDQYINKKLLEENILLLTDWFTDILFDVEQMESIVAPYSRFYCDVERLLPDPDQETRGQGVIYTHSVEGERLRRELRKEECNRIYDIYHTYRKRLSSMVCTGDLLIDCHSFSDDYVGRDDIDICIGYNDDASEPDSETINVIKDCFSQFRIAVNEPFSNSITPRLDFDYKSIMIEVNKRLYMEVVDGTPIYNENNELRWAIEDMYRRLLEI